MTRIRNVSPFGDLIIAGHGVVEYGAEIETSDKTLIESPHFETVAAKKTAVSKSTSAEGKK